MSQSAKRKRGVVKKSGGRKTRSVGMAKGGGRTAVPVAAGLLARVDALAKRTGQTREAVVAGAVESLLSSSREQPGPAPAADPLADIAETLRSQHRTIERLIEQLGSPTGEGAPAGDTVGSIPRISLIPGKAA